MNLKAHLNGLDGLLPTFIIFGKGVNCYVIKKSLETSATCKKSLQKHKGQNEGIQDGPHYALNHYMPQMNSLKSFSFPFTHKYG